MYFRIFRDILALKKISLWVGLDPASSSVGGEYHYHWTMDSSVNPKTRRAMVCPQDFFPINLGIYYEMWELGKI